MGPKHMDALGGHNQEQHLKEAKGNGVLRFNPITPLAIVLALKYRVVPNATTLPNETCLTPPESPPQLARASRGKGS